MWIMISLILAIVWGTAFLWYKQKYTDQTQVVNELQYALERSRAQLTALNDKQKEYVALLLALQKSEALPADTEKEKIQAILKIKRIRILSQLQLSEEEKSAILESFWDEMTGSSVPVKRDIPLPDTVIKIQPSVIPPPQPKIERLVPQDKIAPPERVILNTQPVILRPKQPVKTQPTHRFFSRETLYQIWMPFLWQNIGWFIGGFCFIAGSLMLVLQTSGFWQKFVIYGCLSVYTLLLTWGGYQLRRKQPHLNLAINMLLGLSMLLMPLAIASSVRLMAAAGEYSFLFSLSLTATILGLLIFYPVARIASGVVERAASANHAQFLLSLAALQIAVPFITNHPLGMVLMHGLLFSLLAWALRCFAKNWLKRWFIEREMTALYAAGTLMYAACVSFVHLRAGISFPGYDGAFLMAFDGLLLFVDRQYKTLARVADPLDYLTFVIYGLLLPALMLAWPDETMRYAVFMLGAGIYGAMVWGYARVPPLYLFFFCLIGIYSQAILWPLNDSAYFLASFPALLCLMGLQRFALRRRSAHLAEVAQNIIYVLALGLVIGSLSQAGPGWIGFFTGLSASVLGLFYTRALQNKAIPQYFGIVMLTLTGLYAPLWLEPWSLQASLFLAVLGAAWTLLGLDKTDWRVPGFQSTFLSILFSIVLAVDGPGEALFSSSLDTLGLHLSLSSNREWSGVWILSIAMNALTLWILGLRLRSQGLFSLALVFSAAIFLLVKWRYFSGPKLGLMLWGLCLSLAGILSYLPRVKTIRETTTFSIWGIHIQPVASLVQTVRAPLYYALWLLWLIATWRLLLVLKQPVSLLHDGFFLLKTILAAGATLVLTIESRRAFLMTMSFLWLCLGLSTFTIFTPFSNFEFFSDFLLDFTVRLSFFVFALWGMSRALLDWMTLNVRVPYWRGGWGNAGGYAAVSSVLHHTAFGVQVLVLLASVLLKGKTSSETATLILATLMAIGFFAIAGWRVRQVLHSYFVLAGLVLIGVHGNILDWFLRFNLDNAVALASIALSCAGVSYFARFRTGAFWGLYWLPWQHVTVMFFALALAVTGFSAFSFWPERTPLFALGFFLLAFAWLGLFAPDQHPLRAVRLVFIALLSVAWLSFEFFDAYLANLLFWAALLALATRADCLEKPGWTWISQTAAEGFPWIMALSAYVMLWQWQTQQIEHIAFFSAGLGGVCLIQAHSTQSVRGVWTGAVFLWGGLYLFWPNWPVYLKGLDLVCVYAAQNIFLGAILRAASFSAFACAQPFQTQRAHMHVIATGTGSLLWFAYAAFFIITVPFVDNVWVHVLFLLTGAGILALTWPRNGADKTVYRATGGLTLLYLYARAIAGWSLFVQPTDTLVLLAASYITLILYRFVRCAACYALALVLPILSLLTVFAQSFSIESISLSFLACSTLYAFAAQQRKGIALYLAAFCLNAAIYLWIQTQHIALIQIYTLPAALTVLGMVQLHGAELNRTVRHRLRLSALSVLYVSLAWDVFNKPSLGLFLMVFGLSLLGIILGIALRARAFLYTGTVFLIFNAVSQVVRHTPQDGLAKAVVLVVTGTLITAIMIGLSLQREVLIQKWQQVRGDLARWD